MRRYTYNILATVLFFVGVASIQAQTLDDPTVNLNGQSPVAYTPVQTNADKVWHVVTNTQIDVQLSATKPQDTQERRYTGKIVYKRGSIELSSNTDTFTPTNGEERSYIASFEYDVWTLNPETQQYESTGNKSYEDSDPKSVKFKVYNEPNINDLTVTSTKNYTYVTAESVTFTANYSYNPESVGLTSKIEWRKGSELVQSGNSKTYNLSTENAGNFDINATLIIYAPDKNTTWFTYYGNKAIKIYNKPTVGKLTLGRKFALVGDAAFNVDVEVSNDEEITPVVTWAGGVTGNSKNGSFDPNSKGEFNVSATVTFKDPEGNNLLDPIPSESQKITVYNMPTFTSITPDKIYTVVGNAAFNVKANVTKDNGINTAVNWTGGVTGNKEMGSFNPQTKGEFPISATVTFNDPDGNELITLPKEGEQPITTTITVYNRPSVGKLSLGRKYALVGDAAFNVDVEVSNDEEITPVVTWAGGVTGNSKNGSFDPNSKGEFNVSATVTFKDPEGNNLLDPIPSESQKITVYNMPTFTSITPDKIYTVVDNAAFDVKANVTKDNGINTVVNWTGGVTGNKETGSFNPQTKGEFPISATVTFNDPDGNELITLPKEGGQPITTTITVYNRPTVNGIKLLPNNDDYVYSGSTNDIILDVENIDQGVKPSVEWLTNNIEKDPDDELKAKYTAPSGLTEDESITLRATVTFKDPDDGVLWTAPRCNKEITIRAMVLNPNKLVTYIGDPDFKIDIVGFNSSSGNYDYKPETSWCNEVKKVQDNELEGTLDYDNITIPDDQDTIKLNIKVTVDVYAKAKGSNKWSDKPLAYLQRVLEKEVTVYRRPVINNVNLSADSKYSTIGKERTLTATVDYEPASLPLKYHWVDQNNNNLETEEESNANGEIKIKYTPNSANTEDILIYAKIQVYDPNGKEPWSDEKTTETPLTLKVYPTPDVAVSEETLNGNITENVGDNAGKPEMLVGFDGQPGQGFTYNVSALDTRYKWIYNWQLLDKDKNPIDGQEYNNNSEPKFENLNTGTYYVKLVAEAWNPEDGKEEKWGERVITLDHPITIYSAPVYNSKGNHANASDDTENAYRYSILTDETFDASKLYSYKDDKNKVTGYPKWITTLTVSKDGNPVECDSTTFTPNENGIYTLTLNVKNEAPTGTWLDSKETNGGNDYVYTLYVYDKPQWDIKETTKLFDTPIDNKYNRHVVSGDEIPFVIKGVDGDTDPAKWTITMTCDRINNGNPVSFEKESQGFTYNFSETNTSDEENTYNFYIHGTNDISYLSKDSKPDALDIQGTIHVWKEITAVVTTPNTDNDGKYVLETRVGDKDEQKIKIKLVGGDPTKWDITPTTNNSPEGSQKKDGYDYTYTIQDEDFTTEGTFPYSFIIKYKDGATDISALDGQSISVKVWPEPLITQDLALTNDNKNVKYTEQSGTYNVICYESDELEMTLTPSGGKDNEKWMYKEGSGSKKDVPSNGKITVDGSKTITVYNYLGEKEKEVKIIGTQITRKPNPVIKNVLPTVDNTTVEIWNAAMDSTKRIDLYGDASKPHFSKADFDFSPQSGHEGYENGWAYSWKIDDTEQSKNKGQWSYIASTSPNNAYENKMISVSIKNSIPAGNGQEGENVGLSDSKIYYVKVWHEAILPSENYTLTDEYNKSNDVKTTHAIREGNILTANVAPIQYGFSDNNFYEWKGQGAQANKTNWEAEMSNSETSNKPGKSMTTYGLHVYNKGPRGTIWAEKTFANCDVDIYNKPTTPTSLVIKGQGSQAGTSGTMIVEYADISDTELINRGDYVIDFCYTDSYGDQLIIAKPQTKQGDIRWATGYSSAQMETAFVYSHWLDEENGVLITSGKRTRNGVDETFDLSRYNLSSSEVTEIRDITRAGSGDYEDIIHYIDSNEITEGKISVYNMNGMKVSTSMQGLAPGMYIIRYQQDGVTKSKKLSVK